MATSGPLSGPYPDDWTDPFINPRPITPAAVAPFSAAQLGAMAWHPPIFPGDWTSFPPSTSPPDGLASNRPRQHAPASAWGLGLTRNHLSRRSGNLPLQVHRGRSTISAACSRTTRRCSSDCFRPRSEQTRTQIQRRRLQAGSSPQPARPRRRRCRECPAPCPHRHGRYHKPFVRRLRNCRTRSQRLAWFRTARHWLQPTVRRR